MNLLFYRYGSICEPDIIEGFRELGNQVTEITLEIYNKNLGPLEGLTALKNELFAHSYDFVFSINYYPFISEICNIFQIRYLCWTVDCPVMELYSDTVSNPWRLRMSCGKCRATIPSVRGMAGMSLSLFTSTRRRTRFFPWRTVCGSVFLTGGSSMCARRRFRLSQSRRDSVLTWLRREAGAGISCMRRI